MKKLLAITGVVALSVGCASNEPFFSKESGAPIGVKGRVIAIERSPDLPPGFGFTFFGPLRQFGAGIDIVVGPVFGDPPLESEDPFAPERIVVPQK